MKRNIQLITSLFCITLGVNSLHAASGTWAHSGAGFWDDPANWTGSIVADGAGSLAAFQMNITVNTPVELANSRSIGTVTVQDTSGNQLFSFLGAGVLTLDNGASIPKIRALSGGVAIDFNVVLAGNNGVALPDKSGTVVFSAANTYGGDTVIESQTSGGGTLRVNNADAIPHGAGKGIVTLSLASNNDGILDLNGFSITINGLSGGLSGGTVNGGIVKSRLAGTAVLTVGESSASSTFSGKIQGANDFPGEIALTKIGAGTLTLNGQNTYTGDTTVSEGTLGGNGQISGNVIVSVGGTIGAGASVGTLSLQGGLDLSAGGTNVCEIGGIGSTPGTDFDVINLTGGVLKVNNATLVVKLNGLSSGDSFWGSPHSWTIISVGGAASNPTSSNFATVVNADSVPGNFTTSLDGNGGIVLNYSAVPTVPRPRITSITGAGTTSVTVNWTNAFSASSYVVQYNTNLNNTANWTSLSASPGGTSGSKTDNPPAGTSKRYYRVYGVYP